MGGAGRGSFRGTARGRGSFGPVRPAQVARPISGVTKLTITNLEFGVNDNDVKELFQEFGNMKSSAIHYDSTGRSLGTAHVILGQYPSALKALKQYNGVHLDGRPMKIEIAGQNPAAAQKPIKRLSGTPTAFKGTGARGAGRGARGGARGRGATQQRGRGAQRGRGGRGRGGRGAKVNKAPPKVEDLDAELEAYASAATKE